MNQRANDLVFVPCYHYIL